ncbi:MAG: lipopolysaccharide transport periplasmic protein LptA [Xanthomonadales bacterium]|nr:lipopolysaccharide transport periplasmic protein LptA [Xanthomonadales bacterium]
MKASRGHARRPGVWILCAALGAGLADPLAAKTADRDQPAEIEAGHFLDDPQSGTRVFSNGVTMQQGTLNVEAQTATVYVTDGGNLARIVLEGAPVVWREELDSGEKLTARAGLIDYDFDADKVLLEEDVVIDRGPHRISGPSVRYDLKTSKLDSATDQGRIKVRITPQGDAGNP